MLSGCLNILRFGSPQFRFIHPFDCKSEERHRINLALHLAAIETSEY